jgi:hypothetical protein
MRGSLAAASAAILLAALGGCDHHDDCCYYTYPVNGSGGPILSQLSTTTTIGSTTDAVGQGLNPYGLAIAQTSSGLLEQGDLIVCNFNDAANVQGTGTTLVALHPNQNASPILVANSAELLGCSAVAALPDGNIVAAASQANALQLVSPSGAISTPYSAYTFDNPWGVTYADAPNGPALYVSNSTKGTIDRISLSTGSDSPTGFTEIVTGFSASGVPGSVLAPSGLTYDDSIDTLYVVDTTTNSIVALSNVSGIGQDGVTVTVSGTNDSFSGASASSAKVIASGSPLNGPISAALLPSGNLIVGNTLDPNGTNLLLEVSPTQGVLATRNVDTGNSGAIFGIAIGYDNYGNPVIFFNDDNTNSVVALSANGP